MSANGMVEIDGKQLSEIAEDAVNEVNISSSLKKIKSKNNDWRKYYLHRGWKCLLKYGSNVIIINIIIINQ